MQTIDDQHHQDPRFRLRRLMDGALLVAASAYVAIALFLLATRVS